MTNSTCICTNTDFYNSVQACVLDACTVEQALGRLSTVSRGIYGADSTEEISRIQDEACERPYRSRRADLWGFIAVEVFTLVCVALHIIARRSSLRVYGIDDYIMFVVLVCWQLYQSTLECH